MPSNKYSCELAPIHRRSQNTPLLILRPPHSVIQHFCVAQILIQAGEVLFFLRFRKSQINWTDEAACADHSLKTFGKGKHIDDRVILELTRCAVHRNGSKTEALLVYARLTFQRNE